MLIYRTDFWTLWEKARVGWSERTALKHVYYQRWNRSPVQVGCMRQVLGAGALGWPRGMGWRGRSDGGSGWGTHVNPWLIHVNVWQKPLQYCKVISLQLIKIIGKKKDLLIRKGKFERPFRFWLRGKERIWYPRDKKKCFFKKFGNHKWLPVELKKKKKKSLNTFATCKTPSHVASTYLPIYKIDDNYMKTTTLSLQQGIHFFL